jgi:hypothetical protein
VCTQLFAIGEIRDDTHVHGANTAMHGANTAMHGVDIAMHGANTAMHGANTAMHGVSTAMHGVDIAMHGVDMAVRGVDMPGRPKNNGPVEPLHRAVASPHDLVSRRLEREPPAAVRRRRQRAGVVERRGERQLCPRDPLVAARVEADELAAPPGDVARDRAEHRLRARDLELHDRLERHGSASAAAARNASAPAT